LAAIRPDVLRRITHEKIALYRDETIERRVRAAEAQWRRMARSFLAPQIEAHQSRLDEIKQAAEEAVEQFNDARDDLTDAVAEARGAFEKTINEAQEAFEEAIAQPKEDLDEAKDRMSEIERDLEAVVEQIQPPEPPEQLEAEIDIDRQAPIIRLDWSFEDATAALKARKAYETGDDDDTEAAQ
jgi:chromosome segregation ATPase